MNEVGFSSIYSERCRIEFQFSANREPTMAVRIAMEGSKVEIKTDLTVMPNQPIQAQRSSRMSGCCLTPPWAEILPSIIENPECWLCRSMTVVLCFPIVQSLG